MVKTVPKFEFRGSNLLRDDQTTSRLSSRLRKANYPPHVLGATPSIHYTENIEMYTEVYVTLNNERHNSGYPSSIFLKQILRHRYISQLAVDHRLPAVAKLFVTGNFFIITMLFFRGWKSLVPGLPSLARKAWEGGPLASRAQAVFLGRKNGLTFVVGTASWETGYLRISTYTKDFTVILRSFFAHA